MTDRDTTIEDLEEVSKIIGPDDDEPKERKRKKPSVKRTSSKSLKDRLEEFFALIGVSVYAFDDFDGQTIIEAAPRMAEALNNLAIESPRVKKTLETVLTGGAWAEVVSVVASGIVLPIAVHHRALPEGINARLAEALEVPVKEPKTPEPEAETVSRDESGAIVCDQCGQTFEHAGLLVSHKVNAHGSAPDSSPTQ